MKTIKIYMETFIDMKDSPLYDKYCKDLEQFIIEGHQFNLYYVSEKKPSNDRPIKTAAHLRNTLKMIY